ncbi:MAG TPA: hypothetical protein ENL13_00415 [Thermoplasmatales archaeon]|nr:hypothetical protein [Thermoplasmatales archaeon]
MKNGEDEDRVEQQINRVKSISKMNRELELWIKETEEKKLKKAIKESKKAEEITGKCEICKERDAKFVCIKCHRKVCASCYFSILGLCTECVSKEVVEKWKQENPDWEKKLGIEWID